MEEAAEYGNALDRIQQSYNPRGTCPIPPKKNRLTVAFRAGEKVFKGTTHEQPALTYLSSIVSDRPVRARMGSHEVSGRPGGIGLQQLAVS